MYRSHSTDWFSNGSYNPIEKGYKPDIMRAATMNSQFQKDLEAMQHL